MIELILIPLAVSIVGSTVYDGVRDFIARNNSTLERSISRTSARINNGVKEGAETALRQWTTSVGFARVLERMVAGERDFEDEIVKSFINEGGFYLPDEKKRIAVAKEILATFTGVLVARLYQSDEGLPLLANRIEEQHAGLRERIDALVVGLEEIGELIGLGHPPIERALRYLDNPDDWEYVSEDMFGEGYFHHRIYPEFTLKVGDADSPVVASNEEWTRGEIRGDNNSAWFYRLYYHQTLLRRTRVVTFDDRKKSMVAPDWRTRGKGRFYFYVADSVEYALQRFHSDEGRKDDSSTLRIRGQGKIIDAARDLWGHQMRIPVLYTRESDGFLVDDEILDQSRDELEQYQIFIRNQLDFEEWREKKATC